MRSKRSRWVPCEGRVGQAVPHAPERRRALRPGELGHDGMGAPDDRAVVERECGAQLPEDVRRRLGVRRITVAAGQAVPRREVLVDLEVHLAIDVLGNPLPEPVVGVGDGRARRVRQREVGQRLECDRIHHAGRDAVSRKRPAFEVPLRIDEGVERVVDRHHLPGGVPRFREVPLSLQQRRDAPGRAERVLRFGVLVGHEEEGLVLDQRTAEHAADLIAAVVGLLAPGPVRKPVVGIERGVAQRSNSRCRRNCWCPT